jgi:hypothetical protein
MNKKYPSKNTGLEEVSGECVRQGCKTIVTAKVWPGDKMPPKACHQCKTLSGDSDNDGNRQCI